MQSDQLRALLAIVDTGTFDAAARALHVTPSAVSQRIKSLESQLGRPVVQRTLPCRPTQAGQVLVRMARQSAVLEADALAELDPASSGPAELAVAVNADSLATWFVPVLTTVAGWGDSILRLHVEDQDHSAALLRAGDVIGAVTSDPLATQGCSVRTLGAMRYIPMATPALRDAYRTGRGPDWSRMPVVRFNAKDDLQHSFLARHAVTGEGPPVHVVPSSQAFLAAVVAGLGWGMVPVAQLDSVPTGALVRLAGTDHVDVPLHWQVWRLRSARIDRFTEAVVVAAAAGLR
jgi:LysR family transcriptional regulator (chromosome initiation inhibitor)